MQYLIFLFLADFCASLSYPIANIFSVDIFCSSSEIFAYSNIYILVFLLSINPILKKKYNINLLNIKDYISNYKIIFITLLSVIPSFVKTILLGGKSESLQGITQLTVRSYSMISPFITLILCHFFLKDQKLNRTFIISFFIAFGGLVIFNTKNGFAFNLENIHIVYALMGYAILNSIADFGLKGISKKRSLEIMLFDNLMFLVVSSVIFTWAEFNEEFVRSVFKVERFSLAKLFNPSAFIPTLAVASISFLAHNFKMVSYKAKHIATIIIVGIAIKSFNSIIMTYFEHNVLPTLSQTIGILTMSLGLGFFSYKNRKK